MQRESVVVRRGTKMLLSCHFHGGPAGGGGALGFGFGGGFRTGGLITSASAKDGIPPTTTRFPTPIGTSGS